MTIIAELQAEDYEYWGDEYFTDTSRSSSEMERYISAGFFPEIFLLPHFNAFWNSEGWDYSRGNFLLENNKYLFQSSFAAQPENSDIIDAMTEKEAFSTEDKYGFFEEKHERQIFEIGISFTWPLPKEYRTHINLGLGYTNYNILGFSDIENVPFLTANNTKEYFQKMSMVEIKDRKLCGDLILMHPVYGISMYDIVPGGTQKKLQPMTWINMFYYVLYGISYEYSIYNKANVYEYIVSRQDEIRFANGEIREATASNLDYDKVVAPRLYYTIGLGLHLTAQASDWSIQLYYKGAINSTISGSDYKQNRLCFRVDISANFFKSFII